MVTEPAPIITITTDFGTKDGYLGAMKGAILAINPYVRLVDITHDIAPFDVMEAAFVLCQTAPFYSENTIHLVVVDPGVGSERRGVALKHKGQYYIGPDNGLFTLVLETAHPEELVVLNNPDMYRQTQLSRTFHGRDIFGPVAAHLACGRSLYELGDSLDALSSLHWAIPIDDTHGIRGWIVHVDRFGNCVTNISRNLFMFRADGRHTKCYVGNTILDQLCTTYSDVDPGESLFLFGSNDLLEIAINQGNAASLLQVRRGMPVNIMFIDEVPISHS